MQQVVVVRRSSFVVVVVALEGEGSKSKGARSVHARQRLGSVVEDGLTAGCRMDWMQVVAAVRCLFVSSSVNPQCLGFSFFVSFTFYFLVRTVRAVSTTTTDYLAALSFAAFEVLLLVQYQVLSTLLYKTR